MNTERSTPDPGTTPDAGGPPDPARSPGAPAPASAGADHTLVRLYLELRHGMEEFQRVYGFAPAGTQPVEESAETFLLKLRDPVTGPAARRDLEDGIQQVKLHYAALLEAYQEATQDGSRRLLETVDPEQLRREFEGGKIRVGPVTVPCNWRPLLTQAIWEEMLARFRRYRSLESTDFERFFRDGFRKGYRRFLEGRARRTGDENAVDS